MSKKVLDRRPLKKTVFYWNNQEWTEERLIQIRGKVLESQSKDGTLLTLNQTTQLADRNTAFSPMRTNA